jgi:hypothetical protein
LTLKSLKAKDIEMELIGVYGDEALLISAEKKWRRRFLQGRTELGNDPRSGRPANSDLTEVIAELIREHPFLLIKILYRNLRVSKGRCVKILDEKLGLKSFIFSGFHTSSRRTEHESLKSCHVKSTS